jgi:hypothetical protein
LSPEQKGSYCCVKWTDDDDTEGEVNRHHPHPNHAQHEHAMTPNKTDGTKCLKMLIGHHGVDVKRRQSIRTLMVGGCSFAFLMRHGELSRMKKL